MHNLTIRSWWLKNKLNISQNVICKALSSFDSHQSVLDCQKKGISILSSIR